MDWNEWIDEDRNSNVKKDWNFRQGQKSAFSSSQIEVYIYIYIYSIPNVLEGYIYSIPNVLEVYIFFSFFVGIQNIPQHISEKILAYKVAKIFNTFCKGKFILQILYLFIYFSNVL